MSAAEVKVLMAHRARDNCERALCDWLEAPGARRVLEGMGAGFPYALIVSADTGGDPRYVHAVELLRDLESLQRRLLSAIAAASPCEFDLCYALAPDERDRINRAIDAYTDEQLRRVPAGGQA